MSLFINARGMFRPRSRSEKYLDMHKEVLGKPDLRSGEEGFAAAEAKDSAPPIRPMSVSGRADLGSSGGGESCALCRAGIGKHGQPRQPGAHGSDAGGNPTKLGAPIEWVEGPRLYWMDGR